jgi:ABC-type amino acid transport substrate-binding protein
MTKPTKYTLAVLVVAVIALVGGYIGAGFRDSGGTSATSSGGSWMEKVKQRGELRVGVAIAPPMTVRQGDVLGGPNLIPLEHLAEALGVKLTPVPADWDNIVAGLQAGRYDVAANLDSTVARAKAIQFSDPVYEYQGVFVVKAKSSYKTAKEIIESGEPVAIAQGTAPGAAVAAAGAKTLALNDFTNALQAVQADRAVAEFADLPTAESQVQADPSYKIVVPDPSIYEAGAGYGLPNDTDARSLQLINISIANARMSGELDRAYIKVNYLPIDQLGDLQKK